VHEAGFLAVAPSLAVILIGLVDNDQVRLEDQRQCFVDRHGAAGRGRAVERERPVRALGSTIALKTMGCAS